MEGLYIGLMSGTSVDSIDATLVQQTVTGQQLLHSLSHPWPKSLQQKIRQLSHPGDNEIDQMGELDVEIGLHFAQATNDLLSQQGLKAKDIVAIGSHGQTIRHRPKARHPFTLQIGDPNRIAAITGITVVADFRRRDMAVGGQGAPLAPAFHRYQFSSQDEDRIILNLGGIANVSILPAQNNSPVVGFDTGPASTLMDHWTQHHLAQPYDQDGRWATEGTCHSALLTTLLNDPFFGLPAPKSTGPEYFSMCWLRRHLDAYPDLAPKDVQATLMALTIRSIIDSITVYAAEAGRVIACGGGVHNRYLMNTLRAKLAEKSLETTADHGIDPEFVEAAAFAWLAYQTMNHRPGNLPSVTGAQSESILGGIYLA